MRMGKKPKPIEAKSLSNQEIVEREDECVNGHKWWSHMIWAMGKWYHSNDLDAGCPYCGEKGMGK